MEGESMSTSTVRLQLIKKKRAAVTTLFLFLIVLLCSSCQSNTTGAYVEIFRYLSESTNMPVEYVSFDLTHVQYKHPDRIKLQIEEYMKDSNVTLLWDDMDSLIESGFISIEKDGFPRLFEKGYLIIFRDVELTRTTLITDAMMWFGNLGGYGARFTAEKESGAWKVFSIENEWMS